MTSPVESGSKRWWRLRNIAIAIALAFVAAGGWVGVELWRLQNARPVIAVNYRDRSREAGLQLTGVTSAEGEKSWSALCKVVKLASDIERELRLDPRADGFQRRSEEDEGWLDFSRVREGQAIPNDIDRERNALRVLRDRGFFDLAHEFESMPPGFRPIVAGPMIVELSPELGQARTAAKVLAANMRIASAGGDLGEAVRCFNSSLALAATVSWQAGVVHGLVAMSIESLALSELNALLMEYEFDASQCRDLLQGMHQYARAGVARALESERLVFHDLVQNFFTDDGNGNGFVIPSEFAAMSGALNSSAPTRADWSSTIAARFTFANRRETVAEFDGFMQQLQVEAALPPTQRWMGKFNPDAFVEQLPRSQIVLRIFVPAMRKTVDQWGVSDVQRQGTRLMLEIALFRALHGSYPTSLNQLAPEITPSIPVDPFNGKPWGFRLLESDEHSRPYLLYSTGFDGADDYGSHRAGMRHEAISERRLTGVDYVINAPRE